MSIVRDESSAAFLKSSSVSTTYLPFSYSYPFTISLQGTGSPSAWHTRSYLIGERSSAWSIRKLIWSVRTAVFISTGTCTSPKVSDPFQMDAIGGSPGGWRWTRNRDTFESEGKSNAACGKAYL